MKQHPILFSGSMVRAILDGSKTQTRRVLKDQHCKLVSDIPSEELEDLELRGWNISDGVNCLGDNLFKVPISIGDQLWVREAWCGCKQMDAIKPSDFSKGEPIGYLADGEIRSRGCMMISQGKTRPSIFMPRWASRITLTVTDVRVQRLQDIEPQDCIAEGMTRKYGRSAPEATQFQINNEVQDFAILWNSINSKRAPWESNPWVVAYTFEATQ